MKVNYRIFLFLAIGLVLGIVAARCIGNNYIFITCLIVIILLAAAMFLYRTYSHKKRILSATAILMMFIIGAALCALEVNNAAKELPETVTLTGTVLDNISRENDKTVIYLNRAEVEGERISGKVCVTISGDIEIYNGYKIIINNAHIKNVHAKAFNQFYYRDNVRYTLTVSAASVLAEVKMPTLLYAIRDNIRNALHENMNEINASLSYALLLGNRENMDASVTSAFRDSGLAHALSVSGLHITFLLALLSKLLFRKNKRSPVKFFAFLLLLIFYSALCDFTPSVMRASIMGIIFAASASLLLWYDPLSSLALSGILILLFKPMMLFDAGLQMSFASVFAMYCITPFFTRSVQKYKPYVRKLLAGPITSAAANIGVYPLTVSYYKTFPLYSLISNFVAIPVITVLFLGLFIIMCASLIIPPLAAVYYFLQPLCWLSIKIATAFSTLPSSILNPLPLGTLMIFYYLCLFHAGGFVVYDNFKRGKRHRAYSAVLIISFMLVTIFMGAIT